MVMLRLRIPPHPAFLTARSRALATKACRPPSGLWRLRNEAEVEGTLSVQPQANPVGGFDDYFLGLTIEKNKRNPWFVATTAREIGITNRQTEVAISRGGVAIRLSCVRWCVALWRHPSVFLLVCLTYATSLPAAYHITASGCATVGFKLAKIVAIIPAM
ncbi:hypothetical protein O3P69_019040 [Scylla paramamosain]|uniref:Uncharacterized protein n=1 Tax=Scylla paramamosain TaxID=85552 RepID=A0AAW0T7Q1_SCYPA